MLTLTYPVDCCRQPLQFVNTQQLHHLQHEPLQQPLWLADQQVLCCLQHICTSNCLCLHLQQRPDLQQQLLTDLLHLLASCTSSCVLSGLQQWVALLLVLQVAAAASLCHQLLQLLSELRKELSLTKEREPLLQDLRTVEETDGISMWLWQWYRQGQITLGQCSTAHPYLCMSTLGKS